MRGRGPRVEDRRTASEAGDAALRCREARVGLEVGHEVLEVAVRPNAVGSGLEGGEQVPAVGEEVQRADPVGRVGSIGVPLSAIDPGTTREPCGCVASQGR